MDFTKIGLKNLSAGELQNLAVELLPRLHKDWSIITHNGIVEGSNQTRKGPPDAYCEQKDGTYVFIQTTVDRNGNNAKAKEDLMKSLRKLDELGKKKGALCVAFVSFDANPKYFYECINCAKQMEGYNDGRQLLRKAGLNLAESMSGKRKGQIVLSKRGDATLRHPRGNESHLSTDA
jgi:hypothetical protein